MEMNMTELRNFEPHELQAELEAGRCVLVDVREAAEHPVFAVRVRSGASAAERGSSGDPALRIRCAFGTRLQCML